MNVKNIKVAGNLKYYGEKNSKKIDNKTLKIHQNYTTNYH